MAGDLLILEEEDWTYPQPYKFVQQAGGAIVLAHPYRYGYQVNAQLGHCLPDAIELYFTNLMDDKTEQRLSLIEYLSSQAVCNSDAHTAKDVGLFYNQFEQQVASNQDSSKIIKAKHL